MTISSFVAALAWASLFALSWMLVLGRVATDWKSIIFWVFFFLAAIIASSLTMPSYLKVTNDLAKSSKRK